MGEVVGSFFVTPYSVQRYIERVRPGMAPAKALEELVGLTTAGRKVGPYNGHGLREMAGPGVRLELWRGPRVGTQSERLAQSRMRFVVAYGKGDLPQVVTVLPTGPKRRAP